MVRSLLPVLAMALSACERTAPPRPTLDPSGTPAPIASAPPAPGFSSSSPERPPSTAPSPDGGALEDAAADAGAPGPSAYAGCGVPIPEARYWDEQSDEEVATALRDASACAAREKRRVLIEFVAPWCADCREMTRIDQAPEVARVIAERFERVRVNVGKFDRHEELRLRYGVKAIAAYVVLDPRSGAVLAQTTLEPVTGKKGRVTPEAWATWLRSAP